MAGGVIDDRGVDDGSYRPMAEINVTPFVDVMLVLLIIFMIAAPLMMSNVPLDLPQAAAEAVTPTVDPVIVSVTAEGNLFLAEEAMSEDALIERLQTLRADSDSGEHAIYVRGDRGVDYGTVIALLSKLGQAGFAKVSLVAEDAPASPSGQ